MTTKQIEKVNLNKLIGAGYKKFWESRKPYRVLKGGRGSKKSVTTAYWYIYNLMKYPSANALVVRQTGNTHKDSTYALLKWVTSKLQVHHLWKFKENPMEAEYLPTGQKIIFRGFDDPLKLTSITVAVGVLCWVWIEEAFELDDEQEFRTLDESIRGQMPDGLWKQITLTYNPWVNNHWTKTRFFDNADPDADCFTTTHHINEFLDAEDHNKIEKLQYTDPERYKVVGLGEYGIPGGAYFDEFRTDIHTMKPFVIPDHWNRYVSIDYGLDMFAAVFIAIDTQNRAFIYNEIYQSGLIVAEAAQLLKEYIKDQNIKIIYGPPDLENRRNDTGRSAMDIFREHGVRLIKSDNRRIDGWYAVKEWIKPIDKKDEQTGEIKKTSNLQIFKNCVNLIRTLPQLQYDDHNPNDVSNEPHELSHINDALRGFCIMRTSPTKETSEKKFNFRFEQPKRSEWSTQIPDGFFNK